MKRSTVITAVVAVPAFADAPVSPNPWASWTTYEYEWDYTQNADLSNVCGFDVYTSGNVIQVEEIFIDKEGFPKRFEVHAKGDIDTYAPEFGTSLKVKWAVHISERRIKGTDYRSQTWTGTGWNGHAPGSGDGAVLHDRGRVTLLWRDFDWMLNPPISWSGPSDDCDVLVNRVDWDQAKCDALTR